MDKNSITTVLCSIAILAATSMTFHAVDTKQQLILANQVKITTNQKLTLTGLGVLESNQKIISENQLNIIDNQKMISTQIYDATQGK